MSHYRILGSWLALAALLAVTLTACGTPDTGSDGAQSSAAASPEASAAALTPEPAGASATLTDGSWRLVRYGSAASPTTAIAEAPTASFSADGKISGSGGCNGYGGTYTLSGTALKLDGVAHTEMACVNQDVMTQETRYLAALDSVSELAQTDTTLTLRYPDGELVFEHVAPPPARTLEQTAWRFDGFQEGATVSMIAGADAITAELRDGTISGNGGCNRYSGPATIQGQALTLGPLVSTKMACDALPAEQRFLAALGTVTAWEIVDQRLSLQYPGGSLLFVAE